MKMIFNLPSDHLLLHNKTNVNLSCLPSTHRDLDPWTPNGLFADDLDDQISGIKSQDRSRADQLILTI